MSIRVAVNGLGRTGRQFFRACLNDKEFGKSFDVVAFNDLVDPASLAYFFKYDSVHGTLEKRVAHGEGYIEVDGRRYAVLNVNSPDKLPWSSLGVDVVVESTGLFTSRQLSEGHLKAGAKRVLISAPAKQPDVTLVPGVNMDRFDPKNHTIISAASCTTNCLAPMLKVLLERYGVKRGFMSTVHAYTNDQRVLDLMHKSLRRSRAASVSIIPTTTGAATAIGDVLPELKGKMDGTAFRVPVPDGSIIDLTAELARETTAEEINESYMESARGALNGILKYTEDPIVSADIIGNPSSCIIDGGGTSVLAEKGNFVKILGWYDNEWGYANRLVDIIKYIARNL
ncbi:MAG TPA: type I glyceraldehyde-3-phosphate dehydrogenase [Nitrososphaerales archaeon]|nr:type I glyceraldehyde-3-phosphate dehydrogenase [Nitrososphaerales archaeon]